MQYNETMKKNIKSKIGCPPKVESNSPLSKHAAHPIALLYHGLIPDAIGIHVAAVFVCIIHAGVAVDCATKWLVANTSITALLVVALQGGEAIA